VKVIKIKIFEKIDYVPFYPRVGMAKGTKIITRSGVIFFDIFWTKASTYRVPISFLKTLITAALSVAKRKTSRVQDNLQLAVIHSPWTSTYYHWITESLPRAWAMKKEFPEAVPILPSLKYESYQESLSLIGFDQIRYFPEGDNIKIDSPIITECPPRYGVTSPKLLEEVRNCIIENLGISLNVDPSRIIYVSRKKSRGRLVLNEQKVIENLRKIGAEVVYLEDLIFSDQVRLLTETRLLISIHGAGLTNLVFMRPGGNVIELLPRRNGIFDYNGWRNSFKHDSCYIRLAKAFGIGHHFILCSHDVKFWKKTHMSNIDVPLEKLQVLLDEIL
jgi:hypothetical protein